MSELLYSEKKIAAVAGNFYKGIRVLFMENMPAYPELWKCKGIMHMQLLIIT